MTSPEHNDALRNFIRDCVPNVDAAELLLLLARSSERDFGLTELAQRLRPAEVPEPTLKKYLSDFIDCGLVAQSDAGYRFSGASPELSGVVDALARLYNERPVTLVRMIYSLREERLRAFADAFKLKRN
jgi:hypothetical protein